MQGIINEQNEEILNSYIRSFPCLTELCNGDVGVAITDREKYLLYKPGKKLDLNIPAGTPLKVNTAVYRAIQEGQRRITRGDKAVFGLPYIAMAIPIYNQQREIIGAAVIIESTEQQDAMKELALSLTDSIMILASTTEEISAQTQEIASVVHSLVQVAQESQTRVQETDQVLNLIKSIAGQTNLLGLNAAIEAARVGEQGRGFSVVAEEIRKLAGNSTESVGKVGSMIGAIQVDSKNVYSQMEQVGTAIADIAAALTQLSGAVQQASTMAATLDKLAETLSGDKNEGSSISKK